MTVSLRSCFAFFLGLFSAVSQVVAMRVLAATLYGNEFIFTIVLVGWLVGVAAGSMTFGMLGSGKKVQPGLVATLFILAGLALPLTVLAARYVRAAVGIPPGMLMDIGQAAGIAFLLVLPLSFVYGALFPVLVARRAGGEAGSAARIYALEAMGFVSGGLLATVLLLVSLSALEMACLMLALHATAVAFVSPRYRTVVLAGILILTVLFAGGVIRRLDAVSQAASWRGYHIIESRDSVYGNIQLLEKDGAESLFENGLHVATTGDALSSEESVHYALLASPSPKRLLLIGGGLAGSIREALKYSGLHVDYVELDPAAIDIVRRNIPDAAGAMMDTRVRIIAGDGRRFVKNSDGIYDVIIVNLSDPLTLLVNRYYTEEFFREARRHLSPRGILALGVTSSENYLNKEGWIYLRTLRRTLGMVFAEVRSIPGDRHIFLASSASGTVSLDASVIAGRLKERDIRTRYVREYFFNVRLDPVRIAEAEQGLLGKASVNTDSRPSAFLSALVFWSTHFRSGFSRAVDGVKTAGAVVLLLPVVVALVSVIFRRRRLVASGAIVGAAGFCFMVCQLAVMMAFQSFYGYVYAGIGLVTAAGMAGMFAGSSWGGRVHPMDVASRLQRATVFAAVFVVAFGILLPLVSGAKNEGVVVVSLVACSVLAGFFGGAQFALSTRCAGAETAGGVLYSVDVLGAAVGAVVGGIFFIPLWGITATACFCGLMQAAVLLAFIR